MTSTFHKARRGFRRDVGPGGTSTMSVTWLAHTAALAATAPFLAALANSDVDTYCLEQTPTLQPAANATAETTTSEQR